MIKRLFSYLMNFKLYLLAAFALSVTSNVLALLGPKLSGLAIDNIEYGKSAVCFEKVFYYAALMAVFFAISSILSYALNVLMIHISQKIVHRMRRDVFDSLLKLPVSYFDRNQTGDILSKISYDIDTVNSSLSTDLIQISTSIITVIGSLIMMITISKTMVLVFVITVPLSVMITKTLTRKTRPLFKKRTKSIGELNGYVEEMIAGHKTIKAYGAEESVIRKFDDRNNTAINAFFLADYYGTMVGPCVNLINNISLSFITVLGAVLYIRNRITLGNISSFVLYSRKFSGPINEAANIMNEFQSALAAAERVFRLIDEPKEAVDALYAAELREVHGKVEFQDITFGYEPDKKILEDIDLTAEKGTLTAIVGPTGAGKTTIINLLMRFYDADSGMICLDDKNIRDVKRRDLRKAFAMVLQDTWLFTGTVYENVVYGREDASMEDVVRVCKAAKIHSYIESLPDGYNTVITEEGSSMSKGQKQLLTIARAMLLEANMLILDEATSNVDTMTEKLIQEAMRNLMRDKTCFVIAHRLSTIEKADNIIVIDRGRIVESGTHMELLAKGGMYASMYRSQYE